MIKYVLTLIIGFLYLGYSFAQQTVGLSVNDSFAYDGYTLLTPFSSKKTYLINNCGHSVNSWTSEYTPGAIAYLKPNGNLIRAAHVDNMEFDQAGGNGGRIEEFDWDGNLLWYIDLSTDSFSQHHDFEIMPNGNILVLIWKFVPKKIAIESGRKITEETDGIWQEEIWELEPLSGSGAKIVWKWSVMDHVIQEYDDSKRNFGTISEHPELIDFNSSFIVSQKDWLHFNSIDYNQELDQIMLSCWTYSEIYIIDHSTTTSESSGHTSGNQNQGGDILYRYGNPMAYNRGTQSDQVSFNQHDAQWIPKGYPNEGKVLFFNNGMGRNFSSVEMFSPKKTQEGYYDLDPVKPFSPTKAEWSYTSSNKPDFYSSIMSGVNPLPNGNFLICESTKGHLFEIDRSKKIVWEYVNPINANGSTKQGTPPIGNYVFRSLKYSTQSDAFKDKNVTEGPRLELNPLPILCDDTTSKEDTTINSGEDSTTNMVLNVMGPGISVFPNPFTSVVSVSTWTGSGIVRITNAIGQTVYSGSFDRRSFDLHLEDLSSGLYTLIVSNTSGSKSNTYNLAKN